EKTICKRIWEYVPGKTSLSMNETSPSPLRGEQKNNTIIHGFRFVHHARLRPAAVDCASPVATAPRPVGAIWTGQIGKLFVTCSVENLRPSSGTLPFRLARHSRAGGNPAEYSTATAATLDSR